MFFNKLGANVSNALSTGFSAAKHAADSAKQLAAFSTIAREYQTLELCGGCGKWKIYKATTSKVAHLGPGTGKLAIVSVWVLEKKDLDEAHKKARPGGGKGYMDVLATEMQWLSRLKHPGVIKILEPIEDIRTQLSFVTEAVSCSLDNWLHGWEGIANLVKEETRSLPLSELELKNGLSHVCDTLSFLHSKGIAHCNLSPRSILITADGEWKLCGFGFAQTVSTHAETDAWGAVPFHDGLSNPTYAYDNPYPGLAEALTKPSLQYAAPELVQNPGQPPQSPLTLACDVFSLACVLYEVLSRQPMLTATSASEYRAFFTSVHLLPLDRIPLGMQAMLKQMIAPNPQSRPPAAAVVTAPYLADDMLLRALRFVEHMLQRDLAQKQAFMKDLSTFWRRFDARIIRLRLLPKLVDECRDDAMRGAAIPLILQMVESQSPQDFQDYGLPHIRVVMQVAQGAQLVEIIKMLPKLHLLMRTDQVEDAMIPMLMQALAQGDVALQEEVMKALPPVLDKIGAHCLHEKVLPMLYQACLRTASAPVRGGALRSLASVAPRLPADESEQLLKVVVQITSVDRTAGTLMCSLKVAEAIAKDRPHHYIARHIMPVLLPLVVADSLNPAQFKQFMRSLKDMLARIEECVTGGPEERKPAAAAATGWDEGAKALGPAWQPPPEDPRNASNSLQQWQSPPSTSVSANAWTSPPPPQPPSFPAGAAAAAANTAEWGRRAQPQSFAHTRPSAGTAPSASTAAGGGYGTAAAPDASADFFAGLSVGRAGVSQQPPAAVVASADPFASLVAEPPSAWPPARAAAPTPRSTHSWNQPPGHEAAGAGSNGQMGLLSDVASSKPEPPSLAAADDPFSSLFGAAIGAASNAGKPTVPSGPVDPFSSLAGSQF